MSVKTRQVFREHMVGWVLRQIDDEFDAAGVECDTAYVPSMSGARRSRVEQYYHSINWSDWADVQKVLQVFEHVIHRATAEAELVAFDAALQLQRKKEVAKLVLFLERDGFRLLGGRIVPSTSVTHVSHVKQAAVALDAQYMAQQIKRMEEAVGADPALAIGTAKELIETCCKTILAERGKPVNDSPDMPELTKRTFKELKLVPEGIAESARGADVIKRLLSNLGTIGNGLAELRGLYGTGHGKHGRAVGLTERHAKLAVGAATTLAVFLYDTHMETKAT